ncbi:MAG: hypothetical protein DI626_00395, partial [Micavibrio aeruginosavorus]
MTIMHQKNIGNDGYFPVFAVFLSMTFNAFLCIANTHFLQISIYMIIMAEVAIISAAIWCAYYRIDKIKSFWICIFATQIILISLLSYSKEEV